MYDVNTMKKADDLQVSKGLSHTINKVLRQFLYQDPQS